MVSYIEDSSNLVYQVLVEFESFLDAIIVFNESKETTIKNLSLDSLYIHTRSLSGFFSNKRVNQDDLICSDLVSNNSLCVNIASGVKTYLNKGLAHVSSKRVSLTLDNDDFFVVVRDITLSINSFIDDLDSSITPMHQAELSDAEVNEIRRRIEIKLLTAAKYMIS